MRNRLFAYAKTKTQISCLVTAQLISAFVFATQIVQFLFFLNLKFQASNHLLWLQSPVCVGPGRKPRRPVFSQRGSFNCVPDYLFPSFMKRKQKFFKRILHRFCPIIPVMNQQDVACFRSLRRTADNEKFFNLFFLHPFLASKIHNNTFKNKSNIGSTRQIQHVATPVDPFGCQTIQTIQTIQLKI